MTPGAARSELLSLEGKVALVTGGGGGIGSAVVRAFLASGAKVVSADLPGTHRVDGALCLDCDVADTEAISELFEAIGRQFERLDVLVHCAGIHRDAVLWKMDDESWSDVLHVNLDSAFRFLRAAVPPMRKAGAGAVVLVSSINGERGKFGQANYAASKAGLIGLGRSAARELGRFGIRVNIVAPGLIESGMTESLPEEFKRQAVAETVLGCAGQPEDVANAALFLSTPMSAHITGQVLRVDGGQLMA